MTGQCQARTNAVFRPVVPGPEKGENMITGLDHVVALVKDIGVAKAAYQTLLGRAPAWQNSGEGAERVLFTLANMTIELMAPSGDGAAADRMRALLDYSGGVLDSLVCWGTVMG